MIDTERSKLQLESSRSRLASIESLSLDNKMLVEQFYLRESKYLTVLVGLKVVAKALAKAPRHSVLLILQNTVQPATLHNQVLKLALMNNCPVFYTPSAYLVTSLIGKKYASSCGLLQSSSDYTDFEAYRPNVDN